MANPAWVKGFAPNPGGKPKGLARLQTRLKQKLLECYNQQNLKEGFNDLWKTKKYRAQLFVLLAKLFPSEMAMEFTERRIIFDFSEPKQISSQPQQIPQIESKSLPMQDLEIVNIQGLAVDANVEKSKIQS